MSMPRPRHAAPKSCTMGRVERGVDLVVPIKNLDRAKSRLRGAAPDERHADLVLALLLDTVTAALQAQGVRRVLVVCEDKRGPGALGRPGGGGGGGAGPPRPD